MLIDGHRAKITGDMLAYRRLYYTLAGARAAANERRRGIPLVSRRTIWTVTITGRGWQIIGRARVLFPAFRSERRAVQNFVIAINSHGRGWI